MEKGLGGIIKIIWVLFSMGIRDVKDTLDRQRSISGEVELIFVVNFSVGKVFPEFIVVFFSETSLVLGPDGGDEVDSFTVQGDGEVDEVGVLFDEFLDFSGLGELGRVRSQVDGDLGTSGEAGVVDFGDFESSLTIRNPHVSGFVGVAGLGDDFDSITDDETRVETNTELTNDVFSAGRTILALANSFNEVLGA